jgi:hypothetical protein
MKIRHLMVALALLGAGAAPAQPGNGTVTVTRGADPALWDGSETGGPIVHRASKVSLPAEIAGFRREAVSSASPTDVFLRYRRKDGPTETVASLFLFKPGALPEHSLKGSVRSFAELNDGAFLWVSGPFGIGSEPKLHATKMVFKTGIGPDTAMDYLYFVPLGRWTVKVRGTITGIAKEGEPEAALDAFVAALPWAQILAANGACDGAACSAPAYDPFRSHIGHLMLGRLVAAAMKFDSKQEEKLAVVSRVKVPLTGELEIRQSDEAPLLYVTRVPKLATYRLVRLPDPFKMLFEKGYGLVTVDKPLYGLAIESHGETLMPRFYNGRPPIEVFAADVSDLIITGAGSPFLPVKDYAATLPD